MDEPGSAPGRAITLFTMGFTQKSAEEFFTTLTRAGVRRLIDVRLNNVSQLAGFTKKGDLAYFLREIGDIDYEHWLDLAPTQPMLDALKKHKGAWSAYEAQFLALMAERRIDERLTPALLDRACLLCSETQPDHCHRRLVAEYLTARWGNVEVVHL